MIFLDGTKVQIKGDPGDIFQDIVNLNITIMQDTGLMKIATAAMEAAVDVVKENSFEIKDIKEFKVPGIDKDFKKKGSQ